MTLTFAEAMALDPSEVEVKHRGEWVPLERPNHPCGEFLLSWLRTAELRKKARARRSRVQDIAEAWTREGKVMHADAIATHAIFAVCEYLRTSEAGHMINHDLPGQVEREFLEPRA